VHGANVGDEPIAIFGETAREVRRGGCIRVVLHAPADQFNHYGQQIESFVCRFVDDTLGLGRIAPPGDHPRGFEQLQSARENVRRDRFVARQQLLEVALARHDDVAEHHQRPLVADEVEGTGNRAIGSPRLQ